jgi:hypothetical protein
MRSEYRKMIDMLIKLNPATNSCVSIIAVWTGQIQFITNNLTTDGGLVYLHSSLDANVMKVVPVDQITGFCVKLNRKSCEKSGVEPTLTGVLL